MTTHGKSFRGNEYKTRLAIFTQTVKEIEAHKAKYGDAAWMGLNEFSAMTKEEFAKARLLKPFAADAVSCLANGVLVDTTKVKVDAPPPATWDWSNQAKPVVSPIQNQQQCGSCWAFSTVSAVESAWAIATGTLIKLSEQEVVDCSTACVLEDNQQVCNGGCNGGWPWSALTDVEGWMGLNTEAAYPYTATTDACKRTTTGVFAPVTNYTCLSGPNSNGPNYAVETVMQAFSYSNGPLSIAMDAGILQTYSSGIINPTAGECSTTQLDHAINIVGWGVSGSTQYWKVRNSWGTAWGEAGYFRIIFGKGACGLNAGVTFPNVAAQ
jgi:cathepsin F